MDITHARKIAGLAPLMESEAPAGHESKEKAVFGKACSALQDVINMCEQRLKDELDAECKTQYEELCACAKSCCETMTKHTDSYE